MSSLEIKLLGELNILYDGDLITSTIPSKSQALLAYLAATREVHSRHSLAGLLWGDRSEEKAKNSLRVAISGLRKRIPEHLEVTRQSLGLKLDSAVRIDLAQLERVVEDAAPSKLPPLDLIPQLYRGEFLSGLSLDETPEFNDWIESQRTVWRRTALRGLSRLTEQHLTDEAYDQALKILAHQLEIDPCAEEAHRQAMIAYSRKGDLESAFAQYARCQQALKEKLNVTPAPETIALYQTLSEAHINPSATAMADSANIPLATASSHPPSGAKSLLIGRESELIQLRNMLSDPFCRLITVAGFGGIGKTQLALTLLEEIIQQETVLFLHGVPFVSLVGIESAALIPTMIADSLDSPLSGKRNPLDDLIEMLRQKEMLIILDNFEHLVDEGIDVVNRILNECSQIKLLVTCREWLNVASEWRLALEGLAYPPHQNSPGYSNPGYLSHGSRHAWNSNQSNPQEVDWLLGYSAAQFFMVEARRIDPDFELSLDDVEPLARLCNLVGGIPLALMLAATLIDKKSMREIADAVEKDLETLSSSVEHMPPRQRSMKVVFESSWNQLLGYEQELFQALSVFRGGFTVDAASSLLTAVEDNPIERWLSDTEAIGINYDDSGWSLTLEILDSLSSRGLIQFDETADRYHLHELIRQLAREKLQMDEQLAQTIQRRHSLYFCKQLAHLEIQRKGAQQVAAFRACSAEQENIWVAWQTILSDQRADVVALSVDGLGAFFEWRSAFRDAAQLFEETATMMNDAAHRNPINSSIIAWIRVLSWLGGFRRLTGRITSARDALGQAKQLLEHERLAAVSSQASLTPRLTIDSAKAFWALQNGHLDINVNNSLAQDCYRESVERYHALGLKWEHATALEALSMVSQSVGDLASASQLIQQSLVIRRQIGDLRGTASALSILSTVIRFQGNVNRAIQLARESNELYQSIGDRSSVSEGLQNLGMTLNYVGEFEEALELLEESINIYRDLNNAMGLTKAHANAGHVSGCLGEFDRADYHAHETIAISEALNELRWVAHGCTILGWIAVVDGNYEAAQSYAERSLSLAKGAGGHAEEDIARSVLAYALDGLGKRAEAERLMLRLLRIALREEDFLPLVTAIPKTALMILVQMAGNEHELEDRDVQIWQRRAAIAYQVMKRWPVVSASKLMETPISIPLRKLWDELPKEMVVEVETVAATMGIWDILSELIDYLPSIWHDEKSNPPLM